MNGYQKTVPTLFAYQVFLILTLFIYILKSKRVGKIPTSPHLKSGILYIPTIIIDGDIISSTDVLNRETRYAYDTLNGLAIAPIMQ